MATHRRSVSHYNALTAIVLLLPVCIAQLSGTSTDDSDTISQSSSGFGYELLRSQLDEVQASISQLQQTAERRKECEGLENNIATILNRLETIENGLKVYDSCDDVPSAGVWRIRNGIHISNVYCNKFS
uniref:Uncharacterized protein n=1 Tax=Anopheles minimus TaxID=112268 RepID=A0A182VSH8_9DIPT